MWTLAKDKRGDKDPLLSRTRSCASEPTEAATSRLSMLSIQNTSTGLFCACWTYKCGKIQVFCAWCSKNSVNSMIFVLLQIPWFLCIMSLKIAANARIVVHNEPKHAVKSRFFVQVKCRKSRILCIMSLKMLQSRTIVLNEAQTAALFLTTMPPCARGSWIEEQCRRHHA